MGWDMEDAPDAGTQTTATVLGTNGKGYDTSDHIEEQCGTQDQPQLKETGNQRARRFRDLVCD